MCGDSVGCVGGDDAMLGCVGCVWEDSMVATPGGACAQSSL